MNKIQTQLAVSNRALELDREYKATANGGMIINLGGGRIKLADKTDTNVVKSKLFIPINPETGKPYFSFNDNGFDGVWTAQKVTPIPSSEWSGDDE